MDYQNRSDITASRWHGFTDMESGIVKYSWCMGTDKTGDTCDIISWKNNGMQTSVSFNLHTPLKNGQYIYVKQTNLLFITIGNFYHLKGS